MKCTDLKRKLCAVVIAASIAIFTCLYTFGARTVAPHPLRFSIVTVFSSEPEWLDDLSGRLGFINGLHGWSLYAHIHGYTFRPFFFTPDNSVRLNWNRLAAVDNECAHGLADWVMWTESDVWVTNFDTRLEVIVDAARALRGGAEADVILTNDAIGNLNAGSGLVRCSAVGREALAAVAVTRVSHADDAAVRAWEQNGGWIVLARTPRWRDRFTFVPTRLYNSYPKYVPDWTRFDEGEGDEPFWRHGDFAIHFAGFYRGGMFSFNRSGLHLRVGYPGHADMWQNA